MNRIAAVALALTVLSGCAAADDDGLQTRQSALTRVCGVDKYAGPQGVDVSTYQPNYDWAAQAAAGVRYGYARVSNGTQIIDDQFDRNWPEMKAQGIYRGVYQYFRPNQDAVAQANLVVDRVGRLGPGDMPAMIDVEAADGQSMATIASKVRQWLEIVEAGTGKKPTIYTGAYFWQDNVGDSSFGEYPLWIANYGADCPLVPDGWSTWTFWQYCDGETQYCTNGQGFDRDVFNGTQEQLDALANSGGWGAEIVAVSEPLTLEAGATSSVFVELRNSGTTTWDTSTHLGTTEPRDRESPFADQSWPGSGRPAGVVGTVAPGETYRFEFNVHAPAEPGSYVENFGVVQEAVTWFADQGGPADDLIRIEIEVTEAPVVTDPDPNVDPGDPNTDPQTMDPSMTTGPNQEAAPDGLPPVVGVSPGVEGGCSQVGGSPASLSWLVVLAFAALRRRR